MNTMVRQAPPATSATDCSTQTSWDPNRPRPKGFRDLPIGIDGLYLGGAGCHGGPGITFMPGYNAGYQVLDDLGCP
jgi:phytoene dehydrogenase-like protein